MNNQSLLENTLDMWLDQKQLEYICFYWHAFYSDPVSYRGTVVVSMVLQGMREAGLC